jgi:hypothetical protein
LIKYLQDHKIDPYARGSVFVKARGNEDPSGRSRPEEADERSGGLKKDQQNHAEKIQVPDFCLV